MTQKAAVKPFPVDDAVVLRQVCRTVVALAVRVAALEAALRGVPGVKARVAAVERQLRAGSPTAPERKAAAAPRPTPEALLQSLPPAVLGLVVEEAARHAIAPRELMSRSHAPPFAAARRAAMARAVAAGIGTCRVGRLFDRDPSTVSEACQKHAAHLAAGGGG